MTDPLTIAYMGIGAHRHLTRGGRTLNNFRGGEVEFIALVIAHGETVDSVYDADTCTCVFAYDVAESFGFQAAQQLCETGRGLTYEEALALATRIYKEANA